MNFKRANTVLPLPPGHFGLPLIGENINFLIEKENFAKKRHKKYGDIFKTHVLGNPTIYIQGAEGNLFVLTNENRYFVNDLPDTFKVLLGNSSLSVQTGTEHLSRRKLLYKAFQSRTLQAYIPTVQIITRQYLHKWENIGNLTWYSQLQSYTFDIACKFLIGLDNASKTTLKNLYKTWGDGLFSFPVSLPWTKFGKAIYSRNLLLIEIEKIIYQRQQQPNTGTDALGILLQAQDEDGKRLSLDELKNQLLGLLFAAHETLASALTSFGLLMAQHPNILAKVRVEQEQFESLDFLTSEQLRQMTYLEQVLQEVLRVIPPVGGGFRKVIQDCEFQGYCIPKGWSVFYQILLSHQNSQAFTHAKQFDPERFNHQKAEDKQQRFNYIPFGGGLRECLGKDLACLEMKIFAAMLVRNYDWELIANQNLEIDLFPIPRPRDGLKVNFRRFL